MNPTKLTLEKGNQIFADKLSILLAALGFTIENGIIIRKKKFGREKIGYESLDFSIRRNFKLTYSAVKRIDPIDEIIDDFFSEIYPFEMTKKVQTSVLAFNAKRIRDYKFDPANIRQWIRCGDYYESEATEEGVEQLAVDFFKALEAYVIPTFDKYNNIQLLDACINETPECYYEVIHLFTGNGLQYKKMIIAKLAGSKDYELVCEAMKRRLLDTDPNGKISRETYISVYERIYERLQIVAPLTNPMLD
jgi:hypothetical protein